MTSSAGRGSEPALTNWAGNVAFGAARTHRATSVADVQQVVAGSASVRALGTGHSFNRVADTEGDLVRTDSLPRTIETDSDRRQVRIGGGVRFADLSRDLTRVGLALPNTGSLPHISVAGACATGTHGSGTGNQSLASSVSAQALVTADGDLLALNRGDDAYDGCVIALGRLGVVVDLVLDLVDDFRVAQTVVEDVDDEAVAGGVQTILSAAYSVSIFTGWEGVGRNQVCVKERVGRPGAWDGSQLWGGRLADGPRHPIRGMPPENATAQLGDPGPWNERLPHFRPEFVPSSGDELQSEYVLPTRHAAAAWQALSDMRTEIREVLQVCEMRSLAPAPLWLSLSGGVASVAFHFTWVPDAAAVRPVLAAIEERLAEFRARPHWGKVFGTPHEALESLYPRLPDFRRLVTRLDPAGKFGNALVDHWVGLR